MLRIKFELMQRGITQRELAKRLGVKPQSVSRMINGDEFPRSNRRTKIADAIEWKNDPLDLFKEVQV